MKRSIHTSRTVLASTTAALAVAVALLLGAGSVSAAEIGHYNGGLFNIRDFVVPEPGLYAALYNYFYTTDRLNDRRGDKVNSVTINPGGGPGVTLDVDVKVDMYALAPALLWVSDWKPLGAKYGAVIAPSFANASLEGTLSTATGRGGTAEAGNFDVGDLYVQPVWLGWTLKHWDFALAYGFYAPTGKYDVETVNFPRHRSAEGGVGRQHRVRVLDQPVPGRGGLVPLGTQGHRGHCRLDLRDPWREGRLRPDAWG